MTRLILIVLSVCAAVWSRSQTTEQQTFAAHVEQVRPLKVHLTFHQPYYAPGDTAYFSYYVLDARTLFPIEGRQVVHLELIDRTGSIVYQQQFLSRSGWGSNQFILKPDFPPGTYTLIAFTEWMKNTGAHSFFQSLFYVSGGSVELVAEKATDLAATTKSHVSVQILADHVVRLGLNETANSLGKVTVFCLQHYNLVYQFSIDFSKTKTAQAQIPNEYLQGGLYHIIVLANGTSVGSAIGFKQFEQFHVSSEQIGTLATRTPVKRTIKIETANGEPVLARLSIRVARSDVFRREIATNTIAKSIFFQSEGVSADTNSIRSKLNESFALQSDSKILVGWPSSNQTPNAWQQDIWMTGRFIPDHAVPLSNLMLTLYQPDSDVVSETTLDADGRFRVPFFVDFDGTRNFFPHVQTKGKRIPGRIEFTITPAVGVPAWQPAATLPDNYFHYQTKVVQMKEAFRTSAAPAAASLRSWKVPVKPDFEVDLSRYLIFPDMSEAIREAIPYLQHRKNNDQHEVRLYLADQQRNGEDGPLYVIDGRLTHDTDYFLALPAEEVKKVSGIYYKDKLAHFGQLGSNGIVIVETSKISHGTNLNVGFNFDGFSKSIQFNFLPQQMELRVPAVGPVLCWLPNVKTNELGEFTLEFTTGDEPGAYEVWMEGLTTGGEPVFATFPFQVQHRP